MVDRSDSNKLDEDVRYCDLTTGFEADIEYGEATWSELLRGPWHEVKKRLGRAFGLKGGYRVVLEFERWGSTRQDAPDPQGRATRASAGSARGRRGRRFVRRHGTDFRRPSRRTGARRAPAEPDPGANPHVGGRAVGELAEGLSGDELTVSNVMLRIWRASLYRDLRVLEPLGTWLATASLCEINGVTWPDQRWARETAPIPKTVAGGDLGALVPILVSIMDAFQTGDLDSLYHLGNRLAQVAVVERARDRTAAGSQDQVLTGVPERRTARRERRAGGSRNRLATRTGARRGSNAPTTRRRKARP